MARKLRGCFAGRLVEVTTRTIQGRFLLRPGRLTNQIVTGVVARAQGRTGMKIVGPVAMSNHMHLLLVPETTKQLSEFMRYLNSNVARKVGRLHGWKGKFWAKRYTAIVVTDEKEAQTARLKYLLSQGVKEGLVKCPKDWPGLHLSRALEGGHRSISGGIWLDRSAQCRAAKSAGSPERALDFTEKDLAIELEPLPCWRHLSWKARRHAVCELVKEIVVEARLARGSGRVLGARAIERQDPWTSEDLEPSHAPPCHAASLLARRQLLRELRGFADAFIRASKNLREGRPARFPAGSFPPGLPYVAETTLPDG